MGFTVKNVTGAGAASDTCNVTLTGTPVAAGDLIVAYCGWITNVGTWSFGDNVTSSYTGAAENTGGGWTNANGQFFYKLASVATGFPTYTFTATGSTAPLFIVYVFGPSGTVTYDTGIATASLGPAQSTSPDSGAFTTTGIDELCLGGMMCENDATPVTAQAIGGADATTNAGTIFGAGSATIASWYLATSGANIHATATLNAAEKWIANAISFTNTNPVVSTTVTSGNIIRVPGARRTMIIPG